MGKLEELREKNLDALAGGGQQKVQAQHEAVENSPRKSGAIARCGQFHRD